MTPADNTPDSASISKSGLLESDIEKAFIAQLGDLKYTIRRDIRDETSLHNNFREKFEALNRVKLTDAEFNRLLVLITPDVFAASTTLRNINAFERDDGNPLNFSLVNLKDWCKNDFEVVSQLRAMAQIAGNGLCLLLRADARGHRPSPSRERRYATTRTPDNASGDFERERRRLCSKVLH